MAAGILSDTLSGILCGIPSGTGHCCGLSGTSSSLTWHSWLTLGLGSGSAHTDLELADRAARSKTGGGRAGGHGRGGGMGEDT